jgi:peptide deformylase
MLLIYPSGRLAQKCKPVEDFSAPEFVQTVEDMTSVLTQTGGLGISANQTRLPDLDVSPPPRVFLMAVETKKTAGIAAFVNPTITCEGEKSSSREGCLSFPGVFEFVNRHQSVTIEYQDLTGKKHKKRLTGSQAVCAQHEVDHLDGKTFLDRVSPIKKRMMLRDFQRVLKHHSR